MKASPLPLLLLALLAVGCRNIVIEGQVFQPKDVTATALVTSIHIAPTSTTDLSATTAIERAIRLTLTAAVPSPTDTLTPTLTPTATPTSTDTPEPTVTMKPAAHVTVVPTAQAATQKPTVTISVYCAQFGQSPKYAEVDQPVVLIWGWVAATEAYRQDYIDAASFAVQVDGLAIDVSSATLVLSSQSNGSAALWTLPPRTFSAGTYQAVITVTLSRQITDGFDANNDGILDTFGPAVETRPPCEIVVR